MQNAYAAVARQAAARLAGTFDPRLPQFTEAALAQDGGESRRSVETFLDVDTVIALATFVVNTAQLACMIYIEMKKKNPDPRKDVAIRRIRLELDLPPSISPRDRQKVDQVIEIVVEETWKYDGE